MSVLIRERVMSVRCEISVLSDLRRVVYLKWTEYRLKIEHPISGLLYGECEQKRDQGTIITSRCDDIEK